MIGGSISRELLSITTAQKWLRRRVSSNRCVMPEVVRIYPDGHTVRASVSGWDIEQHIRISSQCRPSCAHVVDGKIRTSGRVSQDTIRAAVVPQSIFENS